MSKAINREEGAGSGAAWSVDGVGVGERVAITKEAKLRRDREIPTIVKHSENTAKTTAEHVILTGTNDLTDVALLPATRMAKYASMAIINCNLQVEKEEDFRPTFEALRPFMLDYSTSKSFRDMTSAVESDSRDKAKDLVAKVVNGDASTKEEKESLKLYKTIKGNYNKLDNKRLTPEQYLEDILFTRICMKEMEARIMSDLEPKLVAHAKEKGYKALTPRPKNRTTYFFAGAPASGKGTAVAIRRREAIMNGENWADMVKINTDTHRDFIIDDRLTTQNIEQKADFNHEESGLVSDMSYRLYKAKIAAGVAPDMLVDAVSVKQSKLNMALDQGGQARIDVVSIPAEKCVERAYSRGLEEKRFVPAEFIISANASVAKEFHNVMAANKGARIEYRVLDNDVNRGEMPILVESGSLDDMNIEVYRRDLLVKFLKKVNLNSRATNASELYCNNYDDREVVNSLHNNVPEASSRRVPSSMLINECIKKYDVVDSTPTVVAVQDVKNISRTRN